MIDKLLPYIPQIVVDHLRQTTKETTAGQELPIDAATLIVRIYGLTASADQLSEQQNETKITSILNQFFEPVIDIIHEHGGIIGTFDGGEMILFFPHQYRERYTTPVKRAIQCGLRIQRATKKIQNEMVSISLKMGMSAGKILTTTVGVENVQKQFIAVGNAFDQAFQAVNKADEGTIFADTKAIKNIYGIKKETHQNGFVPVNGLSRIVRKKPWDYPLPKEFEENQDKLISYIPQPLRTEKERVGPGQYRQVTLVGFHLSDLNYTDDPDFIYKLQGYFKEIMPIVGRYGGIIHSISVRHHAGQLIIILENDDIQKAIELTSEIGNRISIIRYSVPVSESESETFLVRTFSPARSIAIHTTRAFVGTIGSKRRKMYGVCGQSIHIIKHLLETSEENQTLVSESVFDTVQDHFAFRQLKSIEVDNDTIPVYKLEDDLPTLRELAQTAYKNGLYEHSVRFYQQALTFARYDTEHVDTLAQIYYDFARVYYELGNWTQSLIYWDCGLEVIRQLADPKQEAMALRQQGLVYQGLGDYESAGLQYDASFEIAMANDDIEEQIKTFSCMGRWHAEQGHFEPAEALFLETEEMFEGKEEEMSYLAFWENSARMYYLKGELEKALTNYQKCLDLTDDINAIILWQIYYGMAHIYADQKQYDQAIEYYQKAIATMDRIWLNLSTENKHIFMEAMNYRSIYIDYIELLKELGRTEEEEEMLAQVGTYIK